MTHVGLVGCGRWGANIARDLLRLGARVSVADPLHGPYLDHRALPPVDAYVLAAPSLLHARLLGEMVRYGKAIFCEKPLGCDSVALETMPPEARDRIFVMDKWRYHRAIERLALFATSGELGQPLSLQARRATRDFAYDCDCTWILLPHEFSIALEIFGTVPEPARARARSCDRAVKAISVRGTCGDVRFAAFAAIETGRYVRRVTLRCSEGSVVFDNDSECEVSVVRDRRRTTIAVPFEAPLLRELAVFLRHVSGAGPAPKSSFAEGLAQVRAIERVRRLAGLCE